MKQYVLKRDGVYLGPRGRIVKTQKEAYRYADRPIELNGWHALRLCIPGTYFLVRVGSLYLAHFDHEDGHWSWRTCAHAMAFSSKREAFAAVAPLGCIRKLKVVRAEPSNLVRLIDRAARVALAGLRGTL